MNKANLAFVIAETSVKPYEGLIDQLSAEEEPDQKTIASLKARLADVRKARNSEAFRKAIGDSIEVGTVIPSILERNLTEAGFEVVKDQPTMEEMGFNSPKALVRVVVRDKHGLILAMGASTDPEESLPAAALGWCREHPLEGSVVPEGLAPPANAPVQ